MSDPGTTGFWVCGAHQRGRKTSIFIHQLQAQGTHLILLRHDVQGEYLRVHRRFDCERLDLSHRRHAEPPLLQGVRYIELVDPDHAFPRKVELCVLLGGVHLESYVADGR